ncbi:MAG: hypothetical protein EZS28_014566 [Streblomastix strix]|uniref:Uncharacterized protein n=1 Tax=Streblomastix strix TaxID=222440 RepID=A0A5J4W4H9_9EUKA|nr:MAG: hypothetical protein EZS28_014566 [Streblomastix strix]
MDLIIFIAEQIIEQLETQREDQEQLTNKLEKTVTEGLNDNGEEDQSEHAIEPKHITNRNEGFRRNNSGTQFRDTVNGEANTEINITKISTNTQLHNENESKRL